MQGSEPRRQQHQFEPAVANGSVVHMFSRVSGARLKTMCGSGIAFTPRPNRGLAPGHLEDISASLKCFPLARRNTGRQPRAGGRRAASDSPANARKPAGNHSWQRAPGGRGHPSVLSHPLRPSFPLIFSSVLRLCGPASTCLPEGRAAPPAGCSVESKYTGVSWMSVCDETNSVGKQDWPTGGTGQIFQFWFCWQQGMMLLDDTWLRWNLSSGR